MFSPTGTKDLRSSMGPVGKKVSDLAMVQGAHISPMQGNLITSEQSGKNHLNTPSMGLIRPFGYGANARSGSQGTTTPG